MVGRSGLQDHVDLEGERFLMRAKYLNESTNLWGKKSPPQAIN
jgi:hypothetical protein